MADLFYRYRKWREKKRKCKANHHNCSECIYGEHHFEGAVFRGTSCRMEKKMLTASRLSEYPCDILLHNALRFINEGKQQAAYSEICFAILKSGGELFAEERKEFMKDNV